MVKALSLLLSRLLIFTLILASLTGCTQTRVRPPLFFQPEQNTQQANPKSSTEESTLVARMQGLTKKKLTPHETGKVLETAAENFAYGPGLGETALDITGAVLFPPYALVLAGQAVVALSGYEPIRFVDILPDEDKETYQSVMDTVYSGPGRLVSKVKGERYRDKVEIHRQWNEVVGDIEQSRSQSQLNLIKPEFFSEISGSAVEAPAPQFYTAH